MVDFLLGEWSGLEQQKLFVPLSERVSIPSAKNCKRLSSDTSNTLFNVQHLNHLSSHPASQETWLMILFIDPVIKYRNA